MALPPWGALAGVAVAGSLAAVTGVAAACRAVIDRRSAGLVVGEPVEVAALLATGRAGDPGAAGEPVAIVLGAGLRPDGSPTGLLARRVEAAASLHRAGIVHRLVMSGDDDAGGDQPLAMCRYATSLGVPGDHIELDRTGVDTAATCRAARVRHRGKVVVLVTQRFHARRTAYLARKAGIDVIVLATPDAEVRPRSLARARVRELPAAVKAVLVDRV